MQTTLCEKHRFVLKKQQKGNRKRAARVFLVRCAVENHLRWFARFQRCQNKVSFDRPQPEQIKQNKVKYVEFYLIIYVFFVCVVLSISP